MAFQIRGLTAAEYAGAQDACTRMDGEGRRSMGVFGFDIELIRRGLVGWKGNGSPAFEDAEKALEVLSPDVVGPLATAISELTRLGKEGKDG